MLFMEKRIAKVNISSAGGTASKSAKTCKVTLPNSWINALGIDGERRALALVFDGEKIVLSRCLSGEEFAAQKLAQKHDIRLIKFFDNNVLCTNIYADFTDKTLTAENYVNNPVKTAFGNNALPAWEDFQLFLEDRCVPRGRAGLREYLEVIGVGEYDPLEIIRKTAGCMAEDSQWLEIEMLA